MWRSVSWLLNSKFMLCLLTSNVIILWLLSEDSSHVFLDKYYQKKTNCKRKWKSKRTTLPRRRSLGFLTSALAGFHTWPGALRIGTRKEALRMPAWKAKSVLLYWFCHLSFLYAKNVWKIIKCINPHECWHEFWALNSK